MRNEDARAILERMHQNPLTAYSTKLNTIVNGKGEVQGAAIELKTETLSGHYGVLVALYLRELIKTFRHLKTENELYLHKALTYGYIFCCQDCGLITEESKDEWLGTIDMLTEKGLVRVRRDGTHGK